MTNPPGFVMGTLAFLGLFSVGQGLVFSLGIGIALTILVSGLVEMKQRMMF